MATYKNEGVNPVKVQFKKAGKQYGVVVGDGDVFDSADRTTYPFEEQIVAVGETVDFGDVEIVDTVEMTPFSEATQKSLDQMEENSRRA